MSDENAEREDINNAIGFTKHIIGMTVDEEKHQAIRADLWKLVEMLRALRAATPEPRTPLEDLLTSWEKLAQEKRAIGNVYATTMASMLDLCISDLRAALRASTPDLREAIDKARRLTASDPVNIWCRQATVILDAALREP